MKKIILEWDKSSVHAFFSDRHVYEKENYFANNILLIIKSFNQI